jgi:hypothetical protein
LYFYLLHYLQVRAQLEKLASMALRVVKVLAEMDNGTSVSETLAVMEEHCKLRIGNFYMLVLLSLKY